MQWPTVALRDFTMTTSIRCTLPNCSCECFAPGKNQLRTCDQCRHGWVAHALDKLTTSHSLASSLRAEVVHSETVFDIASLMLYGSQAAPIRLRILLDRLFSVLKSEEVDCILQGLGWSHEDYARGYILQNEDGKVFERWTISTKEEEPIILNQFLRFGETKSIAEVMLQELQLKDPQQGSSRDESAIRSFIERIGRSGGRSASFRKSSVHRPDSCSPGDEAQKTRLHQGSVQDRDNCQKNTQAIDHGGRPNKNIPAPNIHLVNLEQTVLKAGVNHTQIRKRNKMNNPGNPDMMNCSIHPVRELTPPPSSSVAPTILNSSVNMFVASTKRQVPFSYKGLRKNSLAKRRAWTPYSVLPNSKQVKCNTCHKWFYDKGTWKIHFSAVHLKVKYKCTVEGCNMAFSSLRSRNRHSTNPSPRIHRVVYNNRHVQNKESISFSEEGIVEESCRTNDQVEEQACTVSEDEDNVAMVMDEDSKASLQTEDVVMLSSEDNVKTNYSEENDASVLRHPLQETNDHSETFQDSEHRDNSSVSELTESEQERQEQLQQERQEQLQQLQQVLVEAQSPPADVKPNVIDSFHRAQDSPTLHHFKKRKSNAPRKVFIPKHEEEVNCQGSDVSRSEVAPSPDVDIKRDADEDEIGIDLGEVANYESASHNNGNSLSDHPFLPSHLFGEMEQSPSEQNKPHGMNDFQSDEQDIFQYNLAEQRGIGIDTCYYINADGLPSCYLCAKTFQSKQTVKVHYQNVHLKLMHPCTIEGCIAMFPSRRSRDRHSTNTNLHRKLFGKSVPVRDGFEQTSPSDTPNRPVEDDQGSDFTSTRSVDESVSANSSEGVIKSILQTTLSGSLNMTSCDNGGPLSSTLSVLSSPNELELRRTQQELHSPPSKHRYAAQDTHSSSSSSFDASPPQRFIMQVDQSGQSPLAYNQTFSSSPPLVPVTQPLFPLKFSTNLVCNICQKAYSTKDTLRTHYKNIHLREMNKCTVQGCNLMFSSVRSRNRHSQNPNLHRHCNSTEEEFDISEQNDEQ